MIAGGRGPTFYAPPLIGTHDKRGPDSLSNAPLYEDDMRRVVGVLRHANLASERASERADAQEANESRKWAADCDRP